MTTLKTLNSSRRNVLRCTKLQGLKTLFSNMKSLNLFVLKESVISKFPVGINIQRYSACIKWTSKRKHVNFSSRRVRFSCQKVLHSLLQKTSKKTVTNQFSREILRCRLMLLLGPKFLKEGAYWRQMSEIQKQKKITQLSSNSLGKTCEFV